MEVDTSLVKQFPLSEAPSRSLLDNKNANCPALKGQREVCLLAPKSFLRQLVIHAQSKEICLQRKVQKTNCPLKRLPLKEVGWTYLFQS